MAIFQNINGTTKSQFKIGPRGVTLSTEISEQISENETIKKLLVDGKAVLLEDKFTIPTNIITKIEKSETEVNKILIYTKKFNREKWIWEDLEPIPIMIEGIGGGEGTVKGPEEPVIDGNFVAFDGTDGTRIKDSNFSTSSKIFNSEYDETGKEIARNPIANSANKIPTVDAVIGYIGDISEILKNRQSGN